MEHITKLCADSLRAFCLNKFGIQLKSSHAHELVAAYFGYSSRAALLADTKCSIGHLKDAEFIVLTPTALIRERRSKLKGLRQDLPEDLAEGVYLPLYDEKLILHSIWPTLEELGKALADQHLKSKPAYFRDQKIQRHSVKIEVQNDDLAIVVFREYVSPNLLLSFREGKRGVIDVFNLKRVAGFIGYTKSNHHSTEAETLDIAVKKMSDVYHKIISASRITEAVPPLQELELSFADWLAKHKKRDSPLGDLASKRGFTEKSEHWPYYQSLEEYREYLTTNRPPLGAMSALERAWRAYKGFLKRKQSPSLNRRLTKPTVKKHDPRTIVFVKNVTPLHYRQRTIEKFVSGEKAWISWEGKKAIPVTVLKVDEFGYKFRIERPIKNAGNEHAVRFDEVRSTPELACINHITY